MTAFEMIPKGCITASDLHSLAQALHRLESWHKAHGGARDEEPCLRLIRVDHDGRISALVQSGDMFVKLVLKGGTWIFIMGDTIT